MKLRTKFLALGVVCSTLVATALGVSLWGAQFHAEQMTQMRRITEITQRHMEADMMHDAIHSDVLAAIVATQNNDVSARSQAREGLERHYGVFRDDLERNRKENLPDAIKASFASAAPALTSYAEGGRAVLDALDSGQDYISVNHDFEDRFEVMEKTNSEISDELAAWAVQVDRDTQARGRALDLLIMVLAAAAIAGVLIMTFAQWIGILRPLGRLTGVIEALARGDDRVEPGYAGRTDEIGILAKAMDVLRGGLSESFLVSQMVKDMPAPLMTVDVHGDLRIRYANPAMDRLGAVLGLASVTGRKVGELCTDCSMKPDFLSNPANLPCSRQVTIGQEVIDLSISPVFDRQGAYQAAMIVWRPVTDRVQLSRDFEQTISTLVDSVAEGASQVAGAASGMRTGLRSSAEVAVAANATAGQTAANVNTVAAAAEELSASVREISAQIQTTNSLVRESHARVQNADTLALKLSSASERVNEVTRVIADISGQINLLALNATIESARAGEAGRGFAVVANEVKTLANQTNRSIGEINGVIDEMRGASGEIIAALHAIKDSVEQITQATTSVAAAVEEQSATTEDIAKNMAFAADGTRVISGNLQEVTDSTGQAEGVSRDLHGSSQSLSEQVTRLRSEVGAFLQRMNAA